MPTFYNQYEIYLKQKGSIPFGRKKLQTVSNRIKRVWDRKPQSNPLTYVDSVENGKTFTVRNYPDSFIRTIDALIKKEKAKQEKLRPAKRIRKRIPLKKK